MAVSIVQNSFTGGEWSPSLYGRHDQAKYATAARKIRNFIVHPHGGISNRGGTQFIGEVKSSLSSVRLITFQFSVQQGYVLEFGDRYMRVIKDDGLVVYASGTYVGQIFELSTPYLEADLPLLKVTQSADILYVTHPSYAPRKITRTGHDAWTIEVIAFGAAISKPTGLASSGGSDFHYVITAVNEDGQESLQSSNCAGDAACVLTWNSLSGAVQYNIYRDSHGGSGFYYYIGSATSTTFKEGNPVITADSSKSPPTAKDPFGSTDNYPGVCTFFDQRLVFARTNNDPQDFWGTVIGDFENMNESSPLRDDDAYNYTINARQVNEIRWLVPLDRLLIGTSGGEFVASGGNAGTITPTNVNVRLQSSWGSSHVQPVVIGNTVLFLAGAGDTVRDLLYNYDVDGYAGNDLTLLANHLFDKYTVLDWAYQQYPDSVLWCIRDDGKLLGLTYKKEQEVWAWHQHDTEDGVFENVAVVQTALGLTDMYVVTKRNINGVSKRYIEKFRTRLPADADFTENVKDAYFVDCGLSLDNPIDITSIEVNAGGTIVVSASSTGVTNGDLIDIRNVQGMTELNDRRFKVALGASGTFALVTEDGAPVDGSEYSTYTDGGVYRKAVTSISGIDHLAGESIVALVDGSVQRDITVSAGGTFALPRPASIVHAGLPYISEIETLDFEYQGEGGTVQDKLRNIYSIVARLRNTRALFAGPNEDSLYEVPMRSQEAYGQPIAMFTGDKEIFINASNPREARVFIRNEDPVPVTILELIARMDNGDA